MLRIFIICIGNLIILVNTYAIQPLRVVSLSPTVTKMLYQLQAQKHIVGCTGFCEVNYASKIPVVATVVDANIEKILLLKPSIIFATGMTQPTIISNLKKLGLNVKVVYSPQNIIEVYKQFIEIGAMVGKEKEAQQIVEIQKQRITAISKKIPANTKPKIFFQIGTKPIFTVISNTFMDEYIKYLGGINIANNLKSGIITRESVIASNPDIIIIAAMGLTATDVKTEWLAFKNLNAVKHNKIFIINSNKSCQATPINFADTFDELVKLIYN